MTKRGVDKLTAEEWLAAGWMARERAVDVVTADGKPSAEKPAFEESREMKRRVLQRPPPLVSVEYLPVELFHAGVAEYQ